MVEKLKNFNWKDFIKAILIILMYLVFVPTLLGLMISPFIEKFSDSIVFRTIINLLVYVVDLAIMLFIYRKSIWKELKDFLANFKNYIVVAFKCWGKGFLLMIIINFIIYAVVGNIASNEQSNREILQELPVFSVLAMVVFGPILEELAFRRGFKDVFKSKKVFLIFTALFFGGMHIVNSLDWHTLTTFAGIAQLFYIFSYSALGYYFGKAYIETDCIFTSITCHMFHNGLSVGLIFLTQVLEMI